MKLFDDFEAVRLPEENLILITHKEYLYYIYNPEYKRREKYENAGNDQLTVRNYQNVREKDIIDAMGGTFPQKETDFMRLCDPSQLSIYDMERLLDAEYPDYMSDITIDDSVFCFLKYSDNRRISFLRLKKLFDDALQQHGINQNEKILNAIKELSLAILGRDVFKKEIGIVDGHDCADYFWIMPVRPIDYSDTDSMDNVAEMRSIEISISEDDVYQYLKPFLFNYFDNDLEANKKRVENQWINDDGNEEASYRVGFEWNLTYNYYTYDSILGIIKDINDTMDALTSGRDTEYTKYLKKRIDEQKTIDKKIEMALRETDENNPDTPIKVEDPGEKQNIQSNPNGPEEDKSEIEMIIDFYCRFIYRMEYMMKVGKENGYELISFMGP